MVQILPLFMAVTVSLAAVWGAVELRMALKGPSATMLNMRHRAGTWAWLLALSAPALWLFPTGLGALCLLLGLVASVEVLQATRSSPRARTGWALMACICTGAVFAQAPFTVLLGGGLAVCVMMAAFRRPLAPALMGLVLLGTAGLASAFLSESPRLAAFGLLALFSTQLSDALQYVVGKLVGQTPLAPRWSPQKTWEGATGGCLLATLCSAGIAPWLGLTPAEASAGALAATSAGVLSGLALSAAKRQLRVKDWGRVLPGHGGVLDRIDSTLPAGLVLGVVATLA